MRRAHRRQLLSDVQVALVVAALAIIGTFLAFRGELPFRSHYTLNAVVPSANNIKPNSPVRIAGVQVGKVESVTSMGDGSQAAKLKLRIEKKGLPIHEDAHIRIRPRIFLEGNFFVDLSPGSPSAPVADEGYTFPINQSVAPVQLDQLLTSLQADTRENLKGVLTVFSDAFAGPGAAGFNHAIPYFKPAYRDSAIVAGAQLGLQEGDLSGYLAGASRTAAALNSDPPKLQSLITDLNVTFSAFAERDDELRATLVSLPRTLRAGLPALASVNRALPPVRRFAADLVPAAKSSGPAIDATLPFVRQLRGLVSAPEARGLTADLRRTVPNLARVNAVQGDLLRQGRLNASCLNETILPWSLDTVPDKTFPASGPVFQDSVKTLPGLAGESRSGDANGQWFRVLVSAGNFTYDNGNGGVMLAGQPLIGTNPPFSARSPLRPDVPCETQQPPDLRTIPTDLTAKAHRAQVSPGREGEYLDLQAKAVAWLRDQLKVEHMTERFKVKANPEVEKLADTIQAKAAAKAKARASKPSADGALAAVREGR